MQKSNKTKRSIARPLGPFEPYEPFDLPSGDCSEQLGKLKRDLAEGRVKRKPLPPIEEAINDIWEELGINNYQQNTCDLDAVDEESYSNPNLRDCLAKYQNLGEEWRRVKNHAGKEAARDFIFKYIIEMGYVDATNEEIATCFNVTVRTVYNWRNDLKQYYAEQFKDLNPKAYIGEKLAYYSKLASTIFSEFSDENTSASEKSRLCKDLLEIEEKKNKFLEQVSFFKVVRYPNPEAECDPLGFKPWGF